MPFGHNVSFKHRTGRTLPQTNGQSTVQFICPHYHNYLNYSEDKPELSTLFFFT